MCVCVCVCVCVLEKKNSEFKPVKLCLKMTLYHIQLMWFANGQGDWSSIPGRVQSKTQKLYLMPSCLSYYKIQIKGKVKRSRERSSALPNTWCGS